jgi:DNA polymerase-1
MVYYIGNERLIQSEQYKHATIKDCINFLKNDCDIISLDTETEGLFNHKNKIVLLQVSNGKDAFAIDVRSNSILPLKEILESKTCLLQNAKFDYKFLKFHGIELTSIIDTFLNECLLTNGLEDRELSLEALAKKYCGKQLDKTTRNQFVGIGSNPFTDKQIIYGVEDVLCLPEINRLQQIELAKWDLLEAVNLEYQACLALADIEYNGLGFNPDAWLKLADIAENNIKLYEKELDNLVLQEPKLKKFVKKGEQLTLFGVVERKVTINWDSPTQMLKLFTALGLKIESSGEKEIQKYQDEFPLVKRFIDYKKDSKLVSTYGRDFLRYINPNTKRIHGDFWQVLNTFRVSCGGSKTNNKNSVNLQNLPAKNEYLNCFIAKEGYKIIGIDYSGQEARIAASGSKDELWVNTFLAGKDLHSEVCKLMFGITDELVRTKPDFLRGKSYRDVAKTINFGVLFGMSEFKLSKTLMISVEEAKALIEKYFAATIQLKSYLDACANYGLRNGYIRSYKPYSGIRWFPDWNSKLDKWKDSKLIGEITRASYNTPVQASGAQMTKRALVLIREYIKNNNLQDIVKIVHVVHDAIYTECKEEFAEEFSKIQSELMIKAGKEYNLLVPMGTDISITNFWSK